MIELDLVKQEDVERLSILATKILREHYDPIIGVAQNDYMLELFQSVDGIKRQMSEGYIFYWIRYDGNDVGFFSYTFKEEKLYLSKLYIDKEYRGKKISREVLCFLSKKAKQNSMSKIFLNVNKHNDESINIYKHLGFKLLREECNPIGNNFFMDDYVLEYTI